MQKKLKILFFFLFFSVFGITLIGQNFNSSFESLDSIIFQNKNLAVEKLNLIFNEASKTKDTLSLIKCYDYYIQIFEQDSANPNIKRFVINEINLLKQYSHSHTRDTSLIYKLFYTYEEFGKLYLYSNEGNTAIDIFLRMIYISQNLRDIELETYTYNLIAHAYERLGNYQKSTEYYQKAIVKARECSDSLSVYKNFFDNAELNFNTGKYSKALSNYYSALLIAEMLKKKYLENDIYNRISVIFFNLAYYEKSLEYLNKAISLLTRLPKGKIPTQQIAKDYLFCGDNYLELNKPEKALSCFKKAGKYLKKSDNYFLIADKNCSIGISYIALKKYNKAKDYLIKAVVLQRKIGDIKGLNKSMLALGKYNLQIENIPKAKYYLLKSYRYSKRNKDKTGVKETSYLLYEIFKNEGNFSRALDFLEEYNTVESFIYKQNIKNSVERVEVEYRYRKKNALTNQRVQILSTEKQKLKLILTLLAIALLAIILLAIFFLRKSTVIKRQKNLIEKQKQIIFKQYERFKLLSLVASHTDNSIFIMNIRGKILWINDSLLKLYSTSHYEIFTVNKADFKKLTHFDYKKVFETCNVERKPITYITEIKVEEKLIWVQTTISPVIENNEVTKLIGIESEITDLKNAQIEIQKQKKDIEFKNKLLEVYNLELKQQKESITAQNEELQQQQEELQAHMELLEEYNRKLHRLSVVASETDNVIYIFDITGRLVWVNSAFTKHTGYTIHEFIEQVGENIISASTVPNIDYYFFSCIEQKKSVTYISEFRTKFGKKLWLQTTLSPIKDKEGKVIEIVAIDSDITETKDAEQKIYQQNQEIKSSLEYAGLIQRSVMPLPIFIDAIFEKNFIFNRPRDIVSGDFFFVHYDNDISVLALADCTGHGIPGAFMSLLGTMALRIIMSRTKSYNPNILLNMLNGEIIKLLHQRGRKNETIDSIDMALCVFDFKSDMVDYSGANIPLYLARKSGNKYTINRIRPTKATIGYDTLKEPFTVHSFKLNKGDRLYMSSDGIADQFGGIHNKKLKRKGFVKMLEYINSLPFNEQEENFELFLNQWMGPVEQIDDMLFIGIEY